MRSNASNISGGKITKTAYALAELCYSTLLEDGLKAKAAVEVTPEDVYAAILGADALGRLYK